MDLFLCITFYMHRNLCNIILTVINCDLFVSNLLNLRVIYLISKGKSVAKIFCVIRTTNILIFVVFCSQQTYKLRCLHINLGSKSYSVTEDFKRRNRTKGSAKYQTLVTGMPSPVANQSFMGNSIGFSLNGAELSLNSLNSANSSNLGKSLKHELG